MRTLSTASSILLTALAALPLHITVASADDLEHKDVPQACMTICDPLVILTNTCDINSHAGGTHTRRRNTRRRRAPLFHLRRDDHGGDEHGSGSGSGGHVDDDADDAAERECICRNTSFDVPKVAALCAACLVQNVPAGGDRDGVEGEQAIPLVNTISLLVLKLLQLDTYLAHRRRYNGSLVRVEGIRK